VHPFFCLEQSWSINRLRQTQSTASAAPLPPARPTDAIAPHPAQHSARRLAHIHDCTIAIRTPTLPSTSPAPTPARVHLPCLSSPPPQPNQHQLHSSCNRYGAVWAAFIGRVYPIAMVVADQRTSMTQSLQNTHQKSAILPRSLALW
jgi:hypothetical protein